MIHYIIIRRDSIEKILEAAYACRHEPKDIWLPKIERQLEQAKCVTTQFVPFVSLDDRILPEGINPPLAMTRSLDWLVFDILEKEYRPRVAEIWGHEFATDLRDARLNEIVTDMCRQLRQPLRAMVLAEVAEICVTVEQHLGDLVKPVKVSMRKKPRKADDLT